MIATKLSIDDFQINDITAVIVSQTLIFDHHHDSNTRGSHINMIITIYNSNTSVLRIVIITTVITTLVIHVLR